MSIKKAYSEIVNLLEANKDVKVSKIFDQIVELASAKSTRSEGSTYLKDVNGNTVAILDYYFKKWMPLVGDKAVDFGQKLKTSTGYNTMCKEGVSAWTKQQREAKNASAELLKKVASGEILPKDIASHQEAIENARKSIVETELGFANQEDLIKYLKKNKVELEQAA